MSSTPDALLNLIRTPSVPVAVRTALWEQAGFPEGTVPDYPAAALARLPANVATAVALRISDTRIEQWWHKDSRVTVREQLALNPDVPDTVAVDVAGWLVSRGHPLPGHLARKVEWSEFAETVDAAGVDEVKMVDALWWDVLLENVEDAVGHRWCAPYLADYVERSLAANPEVDSGSLVELIYDNAAPGTELRCRVAAAVWRRCGHLPDLWADRLAADPVAARTAMHLTMGEGSATMSRTAYESLVEGAHPAVLLGRLLDQMSSDTSVGAADLVRRLTDRIGAELTDVCNDHSGSECGHHTTSAANQTEWPPELTDHINLWVAQLDATNHDAVVAICAATRHHFRAPGSNPDSLSEQLATRFLDRFAATLNSTAAAELVAAAGAPELLVDALLGEQYGPLDPTDLLPIAQLEILHFNDPLLERFWSHPELWAPELISAYADRIAMQVLNKDSLSFSLLPDPVPEILGWVAAYGNPPVELVDAARQDPVASAFWDTLDGQHIGRSTVTRLLRQVEMPEKIRAAVAAASNSFVDFCNGKFALNPPTRWIVENMAERDPKRFRRFGHQFIYAESLTDDLRLELLLDPSLGRPWPDAVAEVLFTVPAGDQLAQVLTSDWLVARWLAGRFAANLPTEETMAELLGSHPQAAAGLVDVVDSRLRQQVLTHFPERELDVPAERLEELLLTTPAVPAAWAQAPESTHASAVICGYAAQRFGTDTTLWQLFAELADGFTGTVEDLVNVVAMAQHTG